MPWTMVGTHMEVTQPPPQRSDALELLVKVAALIAVVLPIVGASVRALAFALAGVQNPLEMAATQPVSGLVITALKASGPSVLPVVVLSIVTYQSWSRPRPGSPITRRKWGGEDTWLWESCFSFQLRSWCRGLEDLWG